MTYGPDVALMLGKRRRTWYVRIEMKLIFGSLQLGYHYYIHDEDYNLILIYKCHKYDR